jgi:hypothetical protein
LIIIYHTQAKVETFRLLYFRLGYCGRDEEVKALTIIAIGSAGEFIQLVYCFLEDFMHSFPSGLGTFFGKLRSTLEFHLKSNKN